MSRSENMSYSCQLKKGAAPAVPCTGMDRPQLKLDLLVNLQRGFLTVLQMSISLGLLSVVKFVKMSIKLSLLHEIKVSSF